MSNPVTDFGHQAAALVMNSLAAVAPDKRSAALRQLFDQLDPALADRVADGQRRLEQAGMAPAAAMQRAMAEAMSRGLVEQFVRAARGDRIPAGMGYCQLGFLDSIGRGIKGIGSTVGGWVGSAAEAIGKLGCKVASNPLGQMAAGGGAAAAGVPPQAGVAGAQVIAQVCNPPPPPSPWPGVVPAGTPEWVIPAAFGGAALVIYLLLR